MPRLGMRAVKRLSKPAFQLINDSLSYSLPNPNRILTRSAWKISRKSRKEQPEEEPASGQADTGRSVLENCIMKEEERILYEAVEKLPPKQKTVLILYYYNDMPIREIARVCGVFEGTVKSRLIHAKEQLKQILTQEEGGKTWTILS